MSLLWVFIYAMHFLLFLSFFNILKGAFGFYSGSGCYLSSLFNFLLPFLFVSFRFYFPRPALVLNFYISVLFPFSPRVSWQRVLAQFYRKFLAKLLRKTLDFVDLLTQRHRTTRSYVTMFLVFFPPRFIIGIFFLYSLRTSVGLGATDMGKLLLRLLPFATESNCQLACQDNACFCFGLPQFGSYPSNGLELWNFLFFFCVPAAGPWLERLSWQAKPQG